MLDTDVPLYELYHENSKLNPITEHEMALRIAAHFEDPGRLYAARRAIKVYPYAPRIELPEPPRLDEAFSQVVARRRSVRSFTPSAVSPAELSFLTRYSYGLTGELVISDEESQKVRAAPSAGALYPIEVYLVVLAAGEIAPGVYHYHVGAHRLELVRAGEFRRELAAAMPAQFCLERAPLAIVLSAAFEKTTHKYGERGYRFVLFDAGHVMQNLWLAATALGLGGYAAGGFRESEMDRLLGIEGTGESSLYCAVFGKPEHQDGAAGES